MTKGLADPLHAEVATLKGLARLVAAAGVAQKLPKRKLVPMNGFPTDAASSSAVRRCCSARPQFRCALVSPAGAALQVLAREPLRVAGRDTGAVARAAARSPRASASSPTGKHPMEYGIASTGYWLDPSNASTPS
jgi:hypothetical protein